MTDEVWVLGATGRSGRAITEQLSARGVAVVLVGRDAARLQEASRRAGMAQTLVTDTVTSMCAEVERQRPAVVINTIGPFAATAVPIARACLAGSHYLDLANDVTAASGLLDLHEQAVSADRTLVTGAGFGVVATESVVVKLCEDRPAALRARVDSLPSLEMVSGVIGDALAATILDGLPEGGRRYEDGRLVRVRPAGDLAHLTLPDGSTETTAGWPAGELIAAQRASGAPFVIAASSEIPTATAVRAILPLATAVLSITPLRNLLRRRLARLRTAPRERPREHSWGHARVQWADGSVREGWLRAGEAQAFTAAVAAVVATRLLQGAGAPGAFTPAAAFGAEIAVEAGGHFVLD